jgi:hypothetical protein
MLTPLMAHQADEGGPQLPRGPAVPDLGFGADPFEHFPDVARVQGGAVVAGKHEPGVVPGVSGCVPLVGLAVLPVA